MRNLSAFVLLLLLTYNASLGQTMDTLRPYAFATFSVAPVLNLHLASFGKLPGIPSCCPEYRGGIGIGYHLSAGYEWLDSPIGPVHIELLLTDASATLRRTEVIGNTIVIRNADTLTVDATVKHQLESSLQAVGFSIARLLQLTPRLEFWGGVQLWYFWNNAFNQQEQLLEPATATFTNGRRIRNAFQGAIPNFVPFHLLPTVGLRYHLPVGQFATLTPFAAYRISLLPLTSVSWYSSQLLFGATYRLPLLPTPPPPIQRDTVYYRDTVQRFIVGLPRDTVVLLSRSRKVEEHTTDNVHHIVTIYQEHYEHRIRKLPVFQVALKVFGIENSTTVPVDTLHIIEEEIFETLPLLPYVYFRIGDSSLTGARLHLLSAEEIQHFDPSALPPDPLRLYREILNVIGYRLRQYPEATLTITGCNNGVGRERNNLSLSAARARAIQQYLITRWGIDSQRIQLRWRNLPANPTNPTIPEGQEENARAELSSSHYEILAPLRLRQLDYKALPPQLLFVGSSVGESAIQQWQFTLKTEHIYLLKQRGMMSVEPRIRWRVPPDQLRHTQHLYAAFTATDPYAQTASVTHTLPIHFTSYQQRRKLFRSGKQIEIFSLILFDFDSAELTDAHLRILETVRQHITPASTVKIYGYTDRIGSPSYNQDLARRRCENVAALLRSAVPPENLHIYPVGSNQLLYDNDFPEGRAYSRTVRIIIETPLDQKP